MCVSNDTSSAHPSNDGTSGNVVASLLGRLVSWFQSREILQQAQSLVLPMVVVALWLSWKVVMGLIACFPLIVMVLFTLTTFMVWYLQKLAMPLRECSPLLQHTKPMSESQRNVCIHDLNTAYNPEGLCRMWQNHRQDDAPLVMLLTGSTGFVGKAVLYQILRTMSSSQESITTPIQDKIILLVRCHKRTSITAYERVAKMRCEPMFAEFQDLWNKVVEVAETSNLNVQNCGMSDTTKQWLREKAITHLIHCAGDVNFNRPLDMAAATNISASLQLQAFAREQWSSTFQQMVYVSTAFCNPKTGTPTEPLQQKLVNLGRYDPLLLYQSMMGDQWLALEAKKRLGFQNNYVFSKCVAEHLLARDAKTQTAIVRPGIVGPAWVLPRAGWNGDKPSTVTAMVLLLMKRIVRVSLVSNRASPMIPVDFVALGIIRAIMAPVTSKRDAKNDCVEQKSHLRIHHLVWDHRSPAKFLSFASLGELTLPYLVLRGYLSTSEGALSMELNRIVSKYPNLAMLLHNVCNRCPLICLDIVLSVVKALGRKRQGEEDSSMSPNKLLYFTDMVKWYEPFQSRAYYFQSSLHVPPSMNVHFYVTNLLRTLDEFLSESSTNTKNNELSDGNKGYQPAQQPWHHLELVPSHRFDFWWALTQPRGNAIIRLMGYLASKAIRATYGSVVLDLESMTTAAKEIIARQTQESPVCLVLAPTHRSFLDFVLVSYIAFSLHSLGINIPYIAAANEFKNVGFSHLLHWAGAFWIERGAGVKDDKLSQELSLIKSKNEGTTTLVVFLEGTRSRDRRFLRPRTGFLRALQHRSGNQDHLVLPLCINYDRVIEHETFDAELRNANKSELSFVNFARWLWDVCVTGKTKHQLGSIRVSFGNPCSLKEDSNVRDIAMHVQTEHRAQSSVTDVHIKVAAKVFNILDETIRTAVEQMGGCVITGTAPIERTPHIQSPTEMWCLHLDWMFRFAHLIYETHPKWAEWLMHQAPLSLDENQVESHTLSEEIKEVVNTLKFVFDSADKLADKAETFLVQKSIKAASVEHLQREMEVMERSNATWLCPPITTASASFVVKDRAQGDAATNASDRVSSRDQAPVMPVFASAESLSDEESFGSWGFVDSGFVISEQGLGTLPTVVFKGSRYSICQRRLPTLIAFFSKALQVKNFSFESSWLPIRCPTPAAPQSSVPETVVKLLLNPSSTCGLGSDQMSIDVRDRCRHGTGHSQEDVYNLRSNSMHRFPDIVVWPENEMQCITLTQMAKENQLCLIPYGGGTNVTHATWCPPIDVDPRPMVSVDMRRMKKLLWVNKEDGLAHVEAGVVGRHLVQELERHGVTMGHEPDSIEFSTLGGWVATRASGMKRNRYGNIEDIVKEVRMVTSTGVMWQNHSQSKEGSPADSLGTAFSRGSIGTELTNLAIGSEGNLGIITSVVIRVRPLPEVTEFASLLFPEFDCGLEFVRSVAQLSSDFRPASVRLMDSTQCKLARHIKGKRFGGVAQSLFSTLEEAVTSSYLLHWKGMDPNKLCVCTLLYEGSALETSVQKKMVGSLAAKYQAISSGSSHGRSGYDLTFAIAYLRDFALAHGVLAESFETFVPWSRGKDLCDGVKRDVIAAHRHRSLPGEISISCRITQLYSEGACVYFYLATFMCGVDEPSRVFAQLEAEARKSCLRHGGSLSHHHGIGKLRAPFLSNVSSKPLSSWLQGIKTSVDPENVFGARNGACNQSMTNAVSESLGSLKLIDGEMDRTTVPGSSEQDAIELKDSHSLTMEESFVLAAKHVKDCGSSWSLSADKALELYALYKCATDGPCTDSRPGICDIVAQKKHKAWKEMGDISRNDAMHRYIAVINEILPRDNK